MLRRLFRWIEAMREAREDAERAERIKREYDVPDYAVQTPEPTGRRIRPREGPTSDYTRKFGQGREA